MRKATRLVVVGMIALLLVGAVGPTLAHETKDLNGNEVTFGGAEEPLITGERMWLEFEIVDAETDEPVENLSENLTASVQLPGHEKTALELDAKHGEPGVYEAPVIFTEPGDYMVHLEGTIDGTEVHTHFEKEVQDRTDLEYPGDDSESGADGTESQPDENETQSAGFASVGNAAVAVGVVGLVTAGFAVYQRRR